MSSKLFPIPGFPGYYATKTGHIWSRRSRWHGSVLSKLHERKPVIGQYGRLRVRLRKDGKYNQRKVARLVLETFVGPCPEGLECCHYDDDQSNNHINNLRWDTHLANIADKTRNGNQSKKLTAVDVLSIRQSLDEGISQVNLAKKFNVAHQTISKIKNRRLWKHISDP